MSKLWKNLWVLGATVMGLALSAPALAVTSAVGPYYATPSWDQTLPSNTRFVVLTNMNSDAVLDRETGLVWEKSPKSSVFTFIWTTAQRDCRNSNVGGRSGWRLPTIEELMSLVDRSVSLGPSLPSGHPFTSVQSDYYWSATTSFDNPDSAHIAPFGGDAVANDQKSNFKHLFWCVRGGPGVDPQ